MSKYIKLRKEQTLENINDHFIRVDPSSGLIAAIHWRGLHKRREVIVSWQRRLIRRVIAATKVFTHCRSARCVIRSATCACVIIV